MKYLLLVLWFCGVVYSQQRFECPENWYRHADHCYRFVAYPRADYTGAAQRCFDDGAAIVSVNTKEEHQFIINWLETNDARGDDWLTSGIVTPSQSGGIQWRGDRSLSQGFAFWVNQSAALEAGATIIYTDAGNEYGWGATRSSDPMSFICEIDITEAYRIVQEYRDFDYGLDTLDPNDIPRGPKFLVEPVHTTILGSTSAVFLECVAHSVPNPNYFWKKRVGVIYTKIETKNDNRYTMTNGRLTINDPTNRDEGYYQCEAENNQGKALSKTVQLSFGVLGEFSNVAVAPTVAKEYEGAQLNCPPIAVKPAGKYQWYKNNIATFIRPSLQSYIFISNNGKLYFSEVTRVDSGRYHCIVSLTSLSGTGNYAGSSQNPSKSSLGFQLQVRSQVGGNYQPVIQDDFISVFPSQPQKGQDIQMECFAYGTGPLSYSWERIGKNMPTNVRYEDHNRKLTILTVGPQDQGAYKCRVFSSATSQSDEKIYNLRIDAEPYFTYPLKDQHADLGSQLTWHCEAAGSPPPTYKWYKNSELLTNQSGVLTIRENVLVIRSLNKDRDSGMYQCGAENELGVVYSTGQLRVLEFAPTFVKRPLEKGISGSVGGNITIVCEPEAAPAPDYTWLKDGADLGLSKGSESGNRRMLMNGNLYITNLNLADQGKYTCRVENSLGTAEDWARLSVVRESVLTRKPSNEKVLVNSTATLFCEASVPQDMDMVYAWTFNNHLLDIENEPHYRLGSGLTRGNLYIINAQFIHAGYYTCNAATGLAVVSSEPARLDVRGPPGEPAGIFQDLKAYKQEKPRDIKIMWTDGANHGADITYYDVEFRTNFNREWRPLKERIPTREALDENLPTKRQTTLTNLKSGAAYEFRVRAMNRYGLGPPSVPSTTIQIPGDRPGRAPDRVGGGGGKVGDLTITWEPLPPEDHNGGGLGYRVFWRKRPTGGSESKWEQIDVPGSNIGKYVTLVGLENFYSEYEVQVLAYNSFGSSNKSYIALVRSAEDLPIGTPKSVYADSFNSTSLIVFWTPVINDRKNMKGKLIGYKVNYWMKDVEDETMATQSIYEGQMDQALIIGLIPDTWYEVNVQVYNSAGNGPKSEDYSQSTDRNAPQLYPTEVHVFSYSSTQVSITFRGVSTQVYEEPLQGYKIQHWRYGEDIRKAEILDCGKNSHGIVGNIEKGVIYQLRVFGYSRGGQGKMSSPATLFTLGGEVRIDHSSTDIMAGSSNVVPAISVLILSLFSRLALL